MRKIYLLAFALIGAISNVFTAQAEDVKLLLSETGVLLTNGIDRGICGNDDANEGHFLPKSGAISAMFKTRDNSLVWGIAQGGDGFATDFKKPSDIDNSFTFAGRYRKQGEFVAQTYVLENDVKSVRASFDISGAGATTTSFSIWSVVGTTATMLTSSESMSEGHKEFSKDNLTLLAGSRLVLIWAASSGGSAATIANFSASYTIGTFTIEPLNYEVTDQTGKVWSGSFNGVKGASRPAFTGVDYSYSNEVWDDAKYTANITFNTPFPISNEGVENWTMVNSFATDGIRWYADGTGIKVKKGTNALNTNLPSYLWAFYPVINEDKSVSFKIKNLSTGTYVHSEATERSHSVGAVTLSPEATLVNIAPDNRLRFNNTANLYVSVNSSTTTDVQNVGVYDSDHDGTKILYTWKYDVKITSAGAATLYTPIPVTIPANVTVKYPSAKDDGGKLSYEEVTGVIPANTAVVLTGTTGRYTFAQASAPENGIDNNMMFGYMSDTDKETAGHSGSIYALANLLNGVGFYTYTGANYLAGRGYLELPASSSRYFSIFDDDDTETAINSVEAEAVNEGVAYDLNGRRVTKTENGIFIINGKKVVK